MPTDDPGIVPTRAYSSWPGLEAKPGEVHMDRAKLMSLAKRLQAHLEDLLNEDEKLVQAPPAAYGTWDAAQTFYSSIQAGHFTLVEQHSRVMHALMDMIKKLHRTAQVSDETEAELERRIAGVDKRVNVLREGGPK